MGLVLNVELCDQFNVQSGTLIRVGVTTGYKRASYIYGNR